MRGEQRHGEGEEVRDFFMDIARGNDMNEENGEWNMAEHVSSNVGILIFTYPI